MLARPRGCLRTCACRSPGTGCRGGHDGPCAREFEVKLTPQTPAAQGDSALGRLTIDKQFHGDLEGVSRGEMLTAMTPVDGSAGYVAIERVSGALHGRKGSFVLQHSGTMTRGAAELVISVVPDSGTGELAGITGRMVITIADGKHSYELEYALPTGG